MIGIQRTYIAGEIEHQHRTSISTLQQGKQEELDGGVFAALPAPNADEKIHR